MGLSWYSPCALLTGFASIAWSMVLELQSRLYLALYDYQGSGNVWKISWTIWLLYSNQLHLHLFHNKCFGYGGGIITHSNSWLFSSSFRIHWLYLCRGVTPPNECPAYNIKLFDGKVPALEIWAMWCTPSLPSLPGQLYVSNRTVWHLNWVQTNDFCLIES